MIFWLFYSFSNKVVDVSQCECGDEYHCIVFVKANTHCLPLKWRSCSSPFYIMIRIFIRWKLNRLRPWLRKWNTGTTPAVDISFCWSTLCCWYPMISYIDNLLLISTWYQHQFFPPSHPLLSLSPPHAMVIFSFSIKYLEFSCSVLPLNNLLKVCYDTSQENKVLWRERFWLIEGEGGSSHRRPLGVKSWLVTGEVGGRGGRAGPQVRGKGGVEPITPDYVA